MKILIADPSSALCEALEEQLKQNHEVMCCSNGRDVFPLIAQHHPQLLILGLELPGIDGLTILQTMHSSRSCSKALTDIGKQKKRSCLFDETTPFLSVNQI